MAKLKVGDKVKVKQGAGDFYQNCSCKDADYLLLTQIGSEKEYFRWSGHRADGTNIDFCSAHSLVESDFILINSNNQNNNMNITEKFALMFKAEPQKSFIKAGITDSNDVLTADGTTVFLSWLLKKNADAFKTEVVDPMLADEAKDCK